MKKCLSVILFLVFAAPMAFGFTNTQGSTYVPPEGYGGGDVSNYMYQNYHRDNNRGFKDDFDYEDDEDYAMPLPKFLQRKKEENAKKLIPHEIKKNSDGKMKSAPMNYSQFPQHYDSSQQMFMLQNQMQQMYSMPF